MVQKVPIPTKQPVPGLYDEELKQLRLVEGDWVRISNGDRKIDRQIRSLTRESNWHTELIFLHYNDWNTLGLRSVPSPAPTAGNPPSNISVNVSKLRLPRDPKVYFAMVAFGLAAGSAFVSYIGQSTPEGSPTVPTILLTSLTLSIVTALASFVTAIAHVQ